MPVKTVLAFDIGIRNLAFCLQRKNTDLSSNPVEILSWDNYDLLAGQSASTAKQSAEHCCSCSAKATYETRGRNYCVRHCPLDRPAFRDLSGNLVKKLGAAKELRAFLQAKGTVNPPKSKGDLFKKISDLYSLPIVKVKVKKAIATELTVLHDGIRRFVLQNKESFLKADEILLENQPVLKNPTMKSVQILLFATLRDLLQYPSGSGSGTTTVAPLRLVHAKMKMAGAKGDEGYKERKDGGEAKVTSLLQAPSVSDSLKWRQHLAKYSKKNDLTDAFLMCWDCLLG
jgi:hypothetical protein